MLFSAFLFGIKLHWQWFTKFSKYGLIFLTIIFVIILCILLHITDFTFTSYWIFFSSTHLWIYSFTVTTSFGNTSWLSNIIWNFFLSMKEYQFLLKWCTKLRYNYRGFPRCMWQSYMETNFTNLYSHEHYLKRKSFVLVLLFGVPHYNELSNIDMDDL